MSGFLYILGKAIYKGSINQKVYNLWEYVVFISYWKLYTILT